MGQEITIVQGVRQTLDKMTPELRAVLPAHIEPAAFIRVAQTAIQNNPELQECTTRSLVASCTRLAEMGLQADGVDAALVVYNVKIKTRDGERWEKQAKPMPMVAGIRDLVRRSGMVKEWKVRLVYSQDHFRHIDGDVETLEHIPEYLEDDRIVKVYSIAYDLDGSVMSRHVMRIDAVDKIRRRSRSADKGPWVTDYEEMVKKTCLRQHSKALPKAKDDLQRERFMGAIRALDDAEDTLALDRGPVTAALPAPAMSVQDAARRRLAEAVENADIDREDEHQAPAAEKAAPKATRKRKTADERLAEANAGKEGNGRPAPNAGHTQAAEPSSSTQTPVGQSASPATPAKSSSRDDEARDLAYEASERAYEEARQAKAEQRENPAPAEPEFGRETADQDEPEVKAFRDGWRTRAAGKTRVPPRTITSGDVAQAWIAGYDAYQKTVDINNAPRDVDASEAMLSRMIDRQFA